MADEHGENMDPLGDREGDAMFAVGETFTMPDEDEMFPGEEVKVVHRGIGRGPWYGGRITYDVVPVDADADEFEAESHRVTQEKLEEG